VEINRQVSDISFPIVIHHIPDCATSRNVLAIIRAAGYVSVVIEYLATGWTPPAAPGAVRRRQSHTARGFAHLKVPG
jgi:hypothetical protein